MAGSIAAPVGFDDVGLVELGGRAAVPARAFARVWWWLMAPERAPWVWRLLLPLVLVVWAVLAGLDATLQQFHVPGIDASGISALASGRGSAETALARWDQAGGAFAGAKLVRPGVSAVDVASAHAWIDMAFAVGVTTVLAMASVWLLAALRCYGADRPTAIRRVLGVSLLFAVPAYLLCDLLESVFELAVLDRRLMWAVPLQWTSVLKWVALAAVCLSLVVAVIVAAAQPGNRVRAFLAAVVRLRIQAVLVVLFAAMMLVATTGDQVQDAMRSWQAIPEWWIFAVVGVALFAVTIAVTGARIVASAGANRGGPPEPWVLLVVGVGVAAVAWVAGGGTTRSGEGVVVLGLIVAFLGLLSLPLRGDHEDLGKLEEPLVPPSVPAPGAADAGAAGVDAKGSDVGQSVATSAADDRAHQERIMWSSVPGLLATVPPVALALACAKVAVDDVLAPGPWPVLLVVLVLVLVAAGVGLSMVTRARVELSKEPEKEKPQLLTAGFVVFVIVAAVGFGIVHWRVAEDVASTSEALGVVALATVFLAEATLVLGIVGLFAERYRPPAALAIVGFRRIPVVLLVVIWGLGGVLLDRDARGHDVVTVDGEHPALTAAAFTDAWITARAASEEGGSSRSAVPLVMVAASGGGVRAATWTALVTDCLFGDHPHPDCDRPDELGDSWGSLFAMSGASGGTIGLASVLAERLGDGDDTGWVAQRLGTDLLSAEVAWQLFAEAPTVFPRLAPGQDRAEVLEQTWAHRWDDTEATCGPTKTNPALLTLDDVWGDLDGTEADSCGLVPLLLANGTSLADGCRFNASVLDAAPARDDAADRIECAHGAPHTRADLTATRDLVDMLCDDEDLTLATTAFLSARFPFVSPTGRLAGPDTRDRLAAAACDTVTDRSGVVHVGDGGYRDNTGISALLELWAAVHDAIDQHNRSTEGPCIVPVFVQIDNGYQNRLAPHTSGLVFESLGPLTGALSVFGTRDSHWSQIAQAQFDHTFAFALQGHPGIQAALGWSLSSSATDDLTRQLRIDANRQELSNLYNQLRPGALSCPTET